MLCGKNSNKFATRPKNFPDPFITYPKNLLKPGLLKKHMSLLFWT